MLCPTRAKMVGRLVIKERKVVEHFCCLFVFLFSLGVIMLVECASWLNKADHFLEYCSMELCLFLLLRARSHFDANYLYHLIVHM